MKIPGILFFRREIGSPYVETRKSKSGFSEFLKPFKVLSF